MEARQEAVTPMQVRETRVYLPNNAGGFDLRDCPNAEELAAFIVRACNAHDDLVAVLAEMTDRFANLRELQKLPASDLESRARSLLAKSGAA